YQGPDHLSRRSASLGAASPPRRTEPRSERVRPVRIATRVDLPAPLRPTSAWQVPASTTSETSRRAWVWPKAFQTLRASPTETPFHPPPSTGSITLPPV